MIRLPIQRTGLALLLLLTGCTRADSSQPPTLERPPLERAMAQAALALTRAGEAALVESDTLRSYTLRLRFNPGRCDAPDYEIFAHGGWQRAAITAEEEAALAKLRDYQAQLTDSPFAELEVTGGWDERVWTTPRGVEWPVFLVQRVEGEASALRGLTGPQLAQRSSGPSGISEGEWPKRGCWGAGSRSTP